MAFIKIKSDFLLQYLFLNIIIKQVPLMSAIHHRDETAYKAVPVLEILVCICGAMTKFYKLDGQKEEKRKLLTDIFSLSNRENY